MISWLHVSDIHLNKLGTETKRMRRQLIPFLKSKGITCKYLFVTGDLRYAPGGDFDSSTVTFLHELKDSIGVSVENVFIVLGNHDVERNTDGRDEAVQKILAPDYYNPKTGEINDGELVVLKSAQQRYISLLEDFYKDIPERMKGYKEILHPHFTVTTEDFNIVHIDSTLSYASNHERDLILGTSMLMDALNMIDNDKPTILLSHYSFDYLNRSEQKEVHRLMMEYNVRMWLAGHEHTSILREQWDYFYEFQSGNLLYEGEESKSCFLLGKYDECSRKGVITGYKWDYDGGWIKDPYIANKGNRSEYDFDISDEKAVSAVFKSSPERNVNNRLENPFVYEGYNDESGKLAGSAQETLIWTNKGRGDANETLETENDSRNESPLKITVYPWNRASGISLLLGEGIQSDYKGWIYLDKSIAPFLDVDVQQIHYDGFDEFILSCETLQITIAKSNGTIIYISVGYNLSRFSDVDTRLYHFRKLKEYMSSKRVLVKMVGHEANNLSFDTALKTEEWNENVALTDYWIEQMERISKIEQFYKVKFYLPVKASDEDYLAINVLSDSIEGKSCRSLLPIAMKNPGLIRTYELEERVPIGNEDRLLSLSLFGFVFKPVRQYILPGRYVWRRGRGWAEKVSGTVPVGVDFEISYEEEQNRELINFIPFKEYEHEFDLDTIPELEGEMDKFFREYISLTHDIQRNRQLFLNYRDVMNTIADTDGSLPHGNILKEKLTDKITVNRLTDNLVSSGKKLVAGLDKLIFTFLKEKDYSRTLWADNLGYVWMFLMNSYSADGRFPVSLSSAGEAYFDMRAINADADAEQDKDMAELIRMFEEYGDCVDTGRLSYYNMLRNYAYTLARIYSSYYEKMDSTVREYAETMTEIVKKNPILIHNGEVFTDVIAYTLESDSRSLHIFDNKADIMLDWNQYRQEADFFCGQQSIGMMGEVFCKER